MAQWQNTNVNFSGANGALAVASGSFSKAGGLALQISDQIRKEEEDKAKTVALNNAGIRAAEASMQNEARLNYLLDTDNRNIRLQQKKNNALVTAADTIASDAKTNMLNALNKDVQAHYVPAGTEGFDQLPGQVYTRPKLGADGKPLIDPTTQQPIMEQYKVDGYSQNKYDTLPKDIQAFDRTEFINGTVKKLLATGLYDPATALQLAQAEASKRIGALPSADTIKSKNDAVTHAYDARMNILANATKGKGGTNITVNGTNTKGTGGSGYTTYTDANDPEINDKWIMEKFTKSRGFFDGLSNVFNDDMALNQNIMRKNQAEYATDYGVTPAQYRAFMNGIVQDGIIGDEYAPETIFEGTPEQRLAIAAKMKKYGHDKTTGKVPTVSGSTNPAATLKAQYKQFKTVLAKGDEVTQAYLQDINRSYQAATPKSKAQIIAAFRNNQIKLMKSQLKDTAVSTVVKPKGTPLFADKKNPISVAMSTKDAPGTSSLVQLLKKDPTAYAKAIKGLTKAEKRKVQAYMETPGFKKIMTAYAKHQITSGGNSNDKDNTPTAKTKMDTLLKTKPLTIDPSDLGDSYDSVTLRKAGYVPKYNALREVISWENPRLIHPKKPSMPMKDIQKYYRMSDDEVRKLPKSKVIKIMSDYKLPAEIRKKLSLRLY